MNALLAILALVALIALTGVFVAAEFSLVTVDRVTVRKAAEGGDSRAARVLAGLRSLSTQLSGAQLGITVASLATGLVAEPIGNQLISPLLEGTGWGESARKAFSTTVVLLLATALSMVFGELVPKNLAIARPFPTARVVAGPQLAFTTAMGPLLRVLNRAADRLVKGMGVEPKEELRSARAPEELISLVRHSAAEGTLAEPIAAMLARALAFDDRTAAEVMTPRTRVTFLPAAAPVAEVVTATRESGHSRFPVVGQSMDDVVGIVHVKHAVAVPPEQRSKRKIRDVMAEPLLVPATLPLDTLLDRLRSRGLQLAVVVDEYGGTDGVVTFEDLIEELVGEVLDEHDESAVAAVVPRDGGWSVSGLLRPDEVSEATQIRLEAGEHETIAGMVLERLGHLPVVGEEVVIDQTRLVVESLDGRRIDRLTLFQIGNEQVDPGSSADSGRQQ